MICESNYPIYLLQSDEEMINFFIIEVEETFSMESIDTIFHVIDALLSLWERKVPFWMTFGFLSSTKRNSMWIKQASEALRLFQLIIGRA